ncbi:MAG: DsbA family protein [Rhizobiales bacterium]|nr:DsbA family protein [Hyphomicrobiales bacterium]
MCSWCWGFSPVFEELSALVSGRARVRYVMGGLRAGSTQPMDEAQKRYIAGHWQHVHERTGQPFNHAFFDRDDFVYDTEPACRAVVTVRGLRPDLQGAMLKALHRAFYMENLDLTDAEVLAGAAGSLEIDRASFLDAFEMEATHDATQIDFAITQQTGIQGFPTVLLGRPGAPFEVVTSGYCDRAQAKSRALAILEQFSA